MHINGYFVTKNNFVAEVTFNFNFERISHITLDSLLLFSIDLYIFFKVFPTKSPSSASIAVFSLYTEKYREKNSILTKFTKWLFISSNVYMALFTMITAQKMKFSIQDFSVNVTKFAVSWKFGHCSKHTALKVWSIITHRH